jgi:AcrR family transcriptional regulator
VSWLAVTTLALSPAERRENKRREMIEAILAAARAVMQEHGVAALNLNEVARRVQLRPQSLAEYFPSKAAVYDALLLSAFDMLRQGDEAAYRNHPPGWEQIEEWFANRIAMAITNPDIYHLAFDAPVPDYVPPDRIVELSREVLAGARAMVSRAIEIGAIDPGMPTEQATDVLLSLRRGLVAERLGKRRYFAPGSRFDELLPPVMHMVKTAWTPATGSSVVRDFTMSGE